MAEIPAPRIETDEDSEKRMASLLCAVRTEKKPDFEGDFRAHYEICDWCKAYVAQRREAEKYVTGGDFVRMPYNEDEEGDF